MDNVLDIRDRLESRRRKKQAEAHRSRGEAIHRVIQCTGCELKCAMCGQHVDGAGEGCPPFASRRGLNLCDDCRAEYRIFLEVSQGRKPSAVFWHNPEWVKMWTTWLAFQRALMDFRNSPEFEQLTLELETEV